MIIIILDSAIENATQIVLYNSLGQLEQSFPVSGLAAGTFRVNFERILANGVYFLEIKNNNNTVYREKVLILKE